MKLWVDKYSLIQDSVFVSTLVSLDQVVWINNIFNLTQTLVLYSLLHYHHQLQRCQLNCPSFTWAKVVVSFNPFSIFSRKIWIATPFPFQVNCIAFLYISRAVVVMNGEHFMSTSTDKAWITIATFRIDQMINQGFISLSPCCYMQWQNLIISFQNYQNLVFSVKNFRHF